jgi:anaerobic selenocysteine-containing dehydrogenase
MAKKNKKDGASVPANGDGGVTRRDFLAGSGAFLGGALLASHLDLLLRCSAAEAGEIMGASAYALSDPANLLYTSCLQCNTGCGIKVKLLDGLAVKVDGSPWSPFNLNPHLPGDAPPARAALLDAPICPKGHAGIQTAYDPYRITKVLKRAGKRGEGKWVTVPFDQAVREIVDGGTLFAHVPGEEKRRVEGLAAIRALKDPAVAKEMAEDAAAIRKAKSAEERAKRVAAFKERHFVYLQTLIDPDRPDLGPKNNQLVYQWGRKKAGRAEFALRFFGDAYGTVNTHGHTTVCQGSLYFTCKALSEQYDGAGFSGGKKFYWQGDLENAEYVLFVGANLFDANYGPPNRSARLTRRLVDGSLKIAVADPRFSKLASKANRYLPVRPGEDGALFQGIVRWMIENGKYDAKYLACANRAAAKAAGEPTWTNACLLVKVDGEGVPGAFLRASEIGLAGGGKRRGADGKERDYDLLVTTRNGVPVAVDPNDEKAAVTGDLFFDGEVGGTKVRAKSALSVLKEAAFSRTLEEWSHLCGVPAADIAAVASELSARGKRGVVDVHRGVAQHTNGFYSVASAMTVNLLLGNFDHRGGMITASAWDPTGSRPGQPFDLAAMHPGKTTRFGVSVIRHDVRYEDTTLFAGYPAKRNWYPLASDVYEEVIPSAGDGYPYPVKALFTYMAAPTYALPAGQGNAEILADTGKIPLYFTSDVTVGPTSMYADYIFPDLSYLERWEMQGSHPNMPLKCQPVRQPVIAPLTERVTVYGSDVPCSFEALLMALAERMGLSGFGKDGLGPGMDLVRPDDFYVRMVANVAMEGEPSPEASDAELDLFVRSRRHLPRTVFDPYRWERTAGPAWRKVVHVLNRGGRFQAQEEGWKGELAANRYGRAVNLYQEKTALTRNSFTGKGNPGYACYVPVACYSGRTPAEEGLLDGFPLHMITQKDITQTKSRTNGNYWLLQVRPENEFLLHPSDAERIGVKTGDRVRAVSATNRSGRYDLHNGTVLEMAGRAKLTESIRPGVVSFTHGHGQWANGASDLVVDGAVVKGDPERAAGVNANCAMWSDPYLKNTCLVDPVGGSVSFYDTRVRIEKA